MKLSKHESHFVEGKRIGASAPLDPPSREGVVMMRVYSPEYAALLSEHTKTKEKEKEKKNGVKDN